MIFKSVRLIDGRDDVTLDCYISDPVKNLTRDALLVIPGGGYCNLCSYREGEPIAEAFIPYGYNAFVLKYSVRENARFPEPLYEASLAMKYIKDNAAEFSINADRVFAIGFSAGGHLAAALGTLWHTKELYEKIDMPFGYNKPLAVAPIYPVISSDPGISHAGSFLYICGLAPDKADKKYYSLEKCVDENTVPMCLVHTAGDKLVNPLNSIRMAEALSKNNIPYELHIYETGAHGMALSNKITSMGGAYDQRKAGWVDIVAGWFAQQK